MMMHPSVARAMAIEEDRMRRLAAATFLARVEGAIAQALFGWIGGVD